MANNKKISQLGLAGGLTGTELVPIVKAGVTVQTTTQDIAGLNNLQTITDAGSTTTNNIASNGGFTALDVSDNAVVDVNDAGISVYNAAIDNVLLEVDRVNDTVKVLGNEVLTVAGGSLTGALNEAKGANIASATTTDLSTATGNLIHITGTTTITAFGTAQAGAKRNIVFDGALILTHNTTSLILPNGLNILTNVNDTAIFISEGSGNWRCVSYQSSDNSAINYSPTYSGVSVAPSGGASNYILNGKMCTVFLCPTVNGTTNATTFTVTLPFNAKYIVAGNFGFVVNGASGNQSGMWLTAASSNILTCYTTVLGAWLNAGGNKRVVGTITYEIA